ncbi:MAG TPA: glycosyltransferase family 1 protein, partial [Halomonas sp.]
MKVVLISQNSSPGILIFRRDLVRFLVSLGHEVYCFALDFSVEDKATVSGWGAIPVDYTLSKTGLNPLIDIRDTFRLSKLLRSLRPDVVFSFFVKPSIYGTIAAKFAGVPRRVAMLEGLGYIHTPSQGNISIHKIALQV